MTRTPRRRIAASFLAVALWVSACSSDEPSAERFCSEVAQLLETDLVNFEASAADDPAVRSGLARTANQFEDVVDAAPELVRPIAEILAGLMRALSEAVNDTDPRDPFERAAALLAAQQQFEDVLPQALERYNAYVAQNCAPQPG